MLHSGFSVFLSVFLLHAKTRFLLIHFLVPRRQPGLQLFGSVLMLVKQISPFAGVAFEVEKQPVHAGWLHNEFPFARTNRLLPKARAINAPTERAVLHGLLALQEG